MYVTPTKITYQIMTNINKNVHGAPVTDFSEASTGDECQTLAWDRFRSALGSYLGGVFAHTAAQNGTKTDEKWI